MYRFSKNLGGVSSNSNSPVRVRLSQIIFQLAADEGIFRVEIKLPNELVDYAIGVATIL